MGQAGTEPEPTATIATLNDAFRRNTRQMLFTEGARTLPDLPGLVTAVKTFNRFTPENDPYGEHDFGAINWHNERTYWKIDYYDQTLTYGVNPLSPDCHRVLTVMLASEY